MATLEPVDRISFVVETLAVRDGKKLGSIRPDEDGYYRDFPLAVLGVPTRNETYYKVDDFVNQMTSQGSFFNKLLVDGNLYGEYGHPKLFGLDHNTMMSRLVLIDEDKKSHHFRKVGVGTSLESGGRMIVGDIKPTGPYGAHLKNDLDDPHMNTAFSLRSLTQESIQGGLRVRAMRKLVTFDYVNAGGYEQASKRYCAATEGLTIEFDPISKEMMLTEVALENFTDAELNDLFKTDRVTLRRQTVTYLKGPGALQFKNSKDVRSLYHELMRQG